MISVEMETPLGSPETLSATGFEKPPLPMTEAVKLTDPPLQTSIEL